MKIDAQTALLMSSPEDLNNVLDLTIDDALSIALSNSDNQELSKEWYEGLLGKLGETEQNAFTMGLAGEGIRVNAMKNNDKFNSLKRHFITIAKRQGCIYEDDYHSACYDIRDSRLIGAINTWLVASGLSLKKNAPGVETEYRKKVKDEVKHPDIRKLKKKIPKVASKTRKPASVHLNKALEELQDKEFKTEFFPPWKKIKEAQADADWATDEAENWLLNDEGLYQEAIRLAQGIGNVYPDIAEALEELLSSVGVMSSSDLASVEWSTLAENVLEWDEIKGYLEDEEDEFDITDEELKEVISPEIYEKLFGSKKQAQGLTPNFFSAEEFTEYLEDTLIPDLEASGAYATAEDFESAKSVIRHGLDAGDSSFVEYLQGTLIPDLRESGSEATAEDFEEAVFWMQQGVEGEACMDTKATPEREPKLVPGPMATGKKQLKKRTRVSADKTAQMAPGQGLEAEKDNLEAQINAQFGSSPEAQQWLQMVEEAPDWATIMEIWRQLFGGRIEQPQQMEQRWPESAPEDYGFIEIQRKHSLTKADDPVEENIKTAALEDFVIAGIRKKVEFDNCAFITDIAESPAQKAAGLEVFDDLGAHEGMLFPFGEPSSVTFHMGKVQFPIDIVFLMDGPSALKVGKIIHNVQPGAIEYWSNADTTYVLELNGGSCKANDIKLGSTCKILDRVV